MQAGKGRQTLEGTVPKCHYNEIGVFSPSETRINIRTVSINYKTEGDIPQSCEKVYPIRPATLSLSKQQEERATER